VLMSLGARTMLGSESDGGGKLVNCGCWSGKPVRQCSQEQGAGGLDAAFLPPARSGQWEGTLRGSAG
jgi:hypothetical protein